MSILKVSIQKNSAYSYDNNTEAVVLSGESLRIELFLQPPWDAESSVSCVLTTEGQPVGKYTGLRSIEIPAEVLSSGVYDMYFTQNSMTASGYQARITKVAVGLSDDDKVITVDRNKRLLNTEVYSLGVQGDMESEIVSFRFPRYADGIDLSTKSISIHYLTSSGFGSVCPASNILVEDAYISFSWVVDRGVTRDVGEVAFAVQFTEVDSQGYEVYNWGTQPARVPVLSTIRQFKNEESKNPNVIAQWMELIQGLAEAPIGSTIIKEEDQKAHWSTKFGTKILAANQGIIEKHPESYWNEIKEYNYVWQMDNISNATDFKADDLVVVSGAISDHEDDPVLLIGEVNEVISPSTIKARTIVLISGSKRESKLDSLVGDGFFNEYDKILVLLGGGF